MKNHKTTSINTLSVFRLVMVAILFFGLLCNECDAQSNPRRDARKARREARRERRRARRDGRGDDTSNSSGGGIDGNDSSSGGGGGGGGSGGVTPGCSLVSPCEGLQAAVGLPLSFPEEIYIGNAQSLDVTLDVAVNKIQYDWFSADTRMFNNKITGPTIKIKPGTTLRILMTNRC